MYASEDVPTDSVYSVNPVYNDENYPYSSRHVAQKKGHRGRDPYGHLKSFGPSLSIDSIPLASPLKKSAFNEGAQNRYEPPHPYGATYTSHLTFDDEDDASSPPSHTASFTTSNSSSASRSKSRRHVEEGKKKSKSDGHYDGAGSSSTHLAPPTSSKRHNGPSRRTILRTRTTYEPPDASSSTTHIEPPSLSRTGRSTSHTGTTRHPDHDRSGHHEDDVSGHRQPVRFASEQNLPRHGVRFVAGDVTGDDGGRDSYVETVPSRGRGRRRTPEEEFWEAERERDRELNMSRERERAFVGEDKKSWRSSFSKRIRRASHTVKSFFSDRVLRSRSMPTFPSDPYYDEPRQRSTLASSWPPAHNGGSSSHIGGGYQRHSQLSLV
ncbi:hypothetical protein ONZ45_g1316 [Pleurotus djamor]|nr:hypothetical protein ONZ45_g1316 [Pleurotus djamor]